MMPQGFIQYPTSYPYHQYQQKTPQHQNRGNNIQVPFTILPHMVNLGSHEMQGHYFPGMNMNFNVNLNLNGPPEQHLAHPANQPQSAGMPPQPMSAGMPPQNLKRARIGSLQESQRGPL